MNGNVVLRNPCKVCAALRDPKRAWYDRPLLQTSNFVVVASLGALVPGWVLVIPRRHELSIARIDQSLRMELGVLIEQVRFQIFDLFGPATVFEHGASSMSSPTGCGLDHAHVHVAPLGFSLIEHAVADKTVHWTKVDHAPHFVQRCDDDYLLVAEEGKGCFIGHQVVRTSQYFRRLIAAAIGAADKYDYARYPFYDNVRRTLDVIREARRISSDQGTDLGASLVR